MQRATARKEAAPAVRNVPTGFVILYHQGLENVCPGCGRRHWYVGRSTAECAFCETALPLAESDASGQCLTFSGNGAGQRNDSRRMGLLRSVRFRNKSAQQAGSE